MEHTKFKPLNFYQIVESQPPPQSIYFLQPYSLLRCTRMYASSYFFSRLTIFGLYGGLSSLRSSFPQSRPLKKAWSLMSFSPVSGWQPKRRDGCFVKNCKYYEEERDKVRGRQQYWLVHGKGRHINNLRCTILRNRVSQEYRPREIRDWFCNAV